MMEVKKLDRRRSYGTVYGDPNIGFVQDECYFRPDGTSISGTATSQTPTDPTTAPTVVSPERRAAQSEAMKKIWAERRQTLAERRLSESESPPSE